MEASAHVVDTQSSALTLMVMPASAAKSRAWISPEEYLASEKLADCKYEYVEGAVFAMAGASADHVRITGNIFAELRTKLRGTPCEAFISDMKVRIPPAFSEAYYYPDVLVGCSTRERDPYVREEPMVIFEVLSPTTERTDRSEKVAAYLHIPSLQAYVIVAQDRPSVTVRFRAGVNWEIIELTDMTDRIVLPGIQCELTLEQIYERVSWRTAQEPL